MIAGGRTTSKEIDMYLANVKTRRKTDRKRSSRYKAKLKAKPVRAGKG